MNLMTNRTLWKHETLLCLVVAVVYLLFFSPMTLPIHPYYYDDMGIYACVGKCMTHGLLPYRDLFDHKGPLFYAIYACGDLISGGGKWGYFLFQILNLMAFMTGARRLMSLFVPRPIAWVLVLLGLALGACNMGCGGQTEEWAATLSVWAMYLVARCLRRSPGEFPASVAFLLGVMLGCHAMIRVTNAAIECGIMAVLGCLMLWRGEYRALVRTVFWSVAGAALVCVACLLWMLSVGCFDDFVAAYFEFNGSYVSSYGSDEPTAMVWLKRFVSPPAWPFLFIYAASYGLSRHLRGYYRILLAMLCSAAFCFQLSILAGRDYPHYYLTAMPVMTCAGLLGWCLWKRLGAHRYIRWGVLVVFALSCGNSLRFSPSALKNNIGHYISMYRGTWTVNICYEGCRRLAGLMADKDSYLGIDVEPATYIYLNKQPACRYFMLQGSHNRVKPSIYPTLVSLLESDEAPRWLLVSRRGKTTEAKKPLLAAIERRYGCVLEDERSGLSLLRLKE